MQRNYWSGCKFSPLNEISFRWYAWFYNRHVCTLYISSVFIFRLFIRLCFWTNSYSISDIYCNKSIRWCHRKTSNPGWKTQIVNVKNRSIYERFQSHYISNQTWHNDLIKYLFTINIQLEIAAYSISVLFMKCLLASQKSNFNEWNQVSHIYCQNNVKKEVPAW